MSRICHDGSGGKWKLVLETRLEQRVADDLGIEHDNNIIYGLRSKAKAERIEGRIKRAIAQSSEVKPDRRKKRHRLKTRREAGARKRSS